MIFDAPIFRPGIFRTPINTRLIGARRPFNPADFGTVDVYFDAASLALANGATVSTWPDLSGNGRNFTTVSGTFTYLTNGTSTGRPAVNMPSNTRMQTPAYQQWPNLAGTFIVVSTPRENPVTKQLVGTFDQTDPDWLWYQTNTSGGSKAFMGGSFITAGRTNVDRLNRPTIQIWRREGAQLRIYDAYVPRSLTITNSQQSNVRLFLGNTSNGAAAELNTIIAYREALSDSVLREIVRSLSRRVYEANPVHVDCCGDSITANWFPAETSYPLQLEAKIGFRFGVYNLGFSGDTIAQCVTRATTGADVFAASSIADSMFIGFVGSNDINSGRSAAAVYADYRAMFLGRPHTRKIAVAMLDRTDFSAAARTQRGIFNDLLAAGFSEFADALARPDLVPELSNPANTAIFPDGVHPNTLGNDFLSTAIAQAVAQVNI